MRKTALIVCMLFVATIATAATEKRVHKTASVASSGNVSIDTHNGTVTVTTWNQPTVDVQARIEPAEFGSADDVDKTEVTVTGSGSEVRIESDYTAVPTHLTWFGVTRNLPLVHYTISMPATAKLTIDDHNADVKVSGLQNDVRVTSHNGSVKIDNLGGAANIETHNGDIRVAFNRFDRSSSFETHNGGIDVQLPQSARFRVNASGHHMDVDSEFPTVVSKSGDRYLGEVNGGGPELKVSTHNGSVRLRKS